MNVSGCPSYTHEYTSRETVTAEWVQILVSRTIYRSTVSEVSGCPSDARVQNQTVDGTLYHSTVSGFVHYQDVLVARTSTDIRDGSVVCLSFHCLWWPKNQDVPVTGTSTCRSFAGLYCKSLRPIALHNKIHTEIQLLRPSLKTKQRNTY